MKEFLHTIGNFMIDFCGFLREYILLGLSLALTFISPVWGALLIVGCFVLFDTTFAVYKEIKLYGKSRFRSHYLFNIAPKTAFYMGCILLGFLIDTFIMEGSVMGINNLISKVMCLIFVYIEVKSIDETSMDLGNRSLWVILKDIIEKAKSCKKDITELKDGESE